MEEEQQPTPRLERPDEMSWGWGVSKTKLGKIEAFTSQLHPTVNRDSWSLGFSVYGSLTAFATVFWLRKANHVFLYQLLMRTKLCLFCHMW